MQAQAVEFTNQVEAAPQSTLALDDLLVLDVPELERLYAEAKVPNLEDVKGDLRGRMLATTVLGGRTAQLAQRWASSDYFVWRGKSFAPRDAERGEGINRVISDRLRLYRFETFVDRSRAGEFDAVQLDYDLPENPFFIRPIKDEIREISPGLYLGQAYLKLRSRTHLVLYFALAS
jgi:hypothetical protein